MRKKQILVVEHDSAIGESIKTRLEADEAFAVDLESTGYGALRSIGAAVPDALLLDATLPDLPGSDVCRLLRGRERTARLPLILLGDRATGLGPSDGLELGADDYIAKPFDLKELLARLRAVLRRHAFEPPPPQDRFTGVHLRADFDEVAVAVDGRPIALTKREFLLLRFLVHNCNQVLDRERILAHVWGAEPGDPRIVDSAMWKLRTKLGLAGRQIATVVGFGYRFNEPPR